jgi:hypothetical protein
LFDAGKQSASWAIDLAAYHDESRSVDARASTASCIAMQSEN